MAVDMRRCEKCGSFYNAAKDSVCPFCVAKMEPEIGVTTPVYVEPVGMTQSEPIGMTQSEAVELGKTEAIVPEIRITEPVVSDMNAVEMTVPEIRVMETVEEPVPVQSVPVIEEPEEDYGRTVAVIKKQMGIDPVVGWLVCKNGVEKGKDYRIHAENNYIGRSETMDICIYGDETITRENHAIVTYDNIKGEFFFTPGMGRSIIRINGNVVLAPTKLNAFDEIEMGITKFVFVPLCGPDFTW